VYNTYSNGSTTPWSQFGGTSAAAPQWAAMTAIVDQGLSLAGLAALDGPSQLLPALYKAAAGDFHDVTSGSSTGSPAHSAATAYDLVTGRGTPVANLLIADLVAWGTSSTTPAPPPAPPLTPTPTHAPSAPSLLSGTALSTSQVSLPRAASMGADGYRLYRLSGSTANLLGTLPAAATSATVTGLSANTTYSFRLEAYSGLGTASATTQVTTFDATPLLAPTNGTVTVLSKSSIQVSWTASAGASGYTVLWPDGAITRQVAGANSRATSVRLTRFKAETTDLFAVMASNLTNLDIFVWVSVTMPTPVAVTAPQNLSFA
jgi:hypothetical protein